VTYRQVYQPTAEAIRERMLAELQSAAEEHIRNSTLDTSRRMARAVSWVHDLAQGHVTLDALSALFP